MRLLPWGRVRRFLPRELKRHHSPRAPVYDRVFREIAAGPGRTALELTRTIYGPHMLYSRVYTQCHRLMEEGRIRREGGGGTSDPYRYYPADDD